MEINNITGLWFFYLKFFLLNSDLPLDTDLENEKPSTVVLAEILGDVIWEDLSECLIKNCLVYSIPTNSSKLQQYEEVKNRGIKILRHLVSWFLLLTFSFPLGSFVLQLHLLKNYSCQIEVTGSRVPWYTEITLIHSDVYCINNWKRGAGKL